MDYQNFFNRDFFPTPVDVIDQMMQFSEVQGKIVLEPYYPQSLERMGGRTDEKNAC